jgi:hypothetical protein
MGYNSGNYAPVIGPAPTAQANVYAVQSNVNIVDEPAAQPAPSSDIPSKRPSLYDSNKLNKYAF